MYAPTPPQDSTATKDPKTAEPEESTEAAKVTPEPTVTPDGQINDT